MTRWVDEHSDDVVDFFVELVAQVGHVFEDLGKLGPAFTFLWDALKEVGDWLQKIIGQPNKDGLAGVRHLLEFISGIVMARFVISMVAGFTAAFAPVTALLLALGALGVISLGAYTAGEAVRDWWGGGSGGGGPGSGKGGETGLEGQTGAGGKSRGRFTHGGGGGE